MKRLMPSSIGLLGLLVISSALTGCETLSLFTEASNPGYTNKTEVPIDTPAKQQPVSPPSVELVPAVPLQVNLIPQAAENAGVVRCAQRVKQVTDLLTKQTQHGAQFFIGAGAADQSTVSIVLETQSPKAVSFVDTAFVPGRKENECGALYEKINYWNMSCDVLASTQFATFKKAGALKQAIQMLEAGPQHKVFLLPAGPHCVSIVKELVYK